jgi:hypothetical protein
LNLEVSIQFHELEKWTVLMQFNIYKSGPNSEI